MRATKVALLVFSPPMVSFDQEHAYLPVKTVAEYFYCQRAAFYMVMRWENNLENPYLYKGTQQHQAIERMPYKHRSDAKILYRYSVVSEEIRIYGICDAVVFPEMGVPYPVEYKTGKTRTNVMHRAQLYLQAACLEEMHGVAIPRGYVYFIESNKRKEVCFSADEKVRVLDTLKEMCDKLSHPDIREFPPCGHPFCSYHAIDDPVLYGKTR